MTPDEHKMLRAGSVWFPLAMVVSMLIFVATFAWIASGEKTRIDSKFDNLAEQLKNLTNNVEKLAMRVGQPDGDYVTRQQWLVECLQHEILNPTWRCAYGARRNKVSLPDITGTILEYNSASN